MKRWIANYIDPDMQAQNENLQSLQQYMPAPLLCELPWSDGSSNSPKFVIRRLGV